MSCQRQQKWHLIMVMNKVLYPPYHLLSSKQHSAPQRSLKRKVNALVLKFIITDVQPFSLVEHAPFCMMTEGISRGFIGVTCHWIDPQTSDQKSAALACERIRGHDTYDVIAAKFTEIHAEFQIQGKVSATVTDNSSNFVKVLNEHGGCVYSS